MSEARDVWVKLGELSAVVGMMEATLSSKSDQYENVMEGWGERLDAIVGYAYYNSRRSSSLASSTTNE